MKKIALIAFREFVVRIRNKTFLISTLLLPIGIIVFYGAVFLFSSNDFETYRVGVLDPKKEISRELKDNDNFKFIELGEDFNPNDKSIAEKYDLSATLVAPQNQQNMLDGKLKIIAYKKIGLITKGKLEDMLQGIIETKRFSQMNLDSADVHAIQKPISLSYADLNGKNENELKEGISYALGFGFGMLMYMILTIYGAQVMRGVMEEKTNRIVEIIISSVKPFELLMGKIIGIAMVSFLQLLCWGVLILIIMMGFGLFMSGQMPDMAALGGFQPSAMKMAMDPEMQKTFQSLQSIDFLPIVACFLFYFLAGFFLYSSLFAAVGSAVGDDPQDVQSLMFPIMMPIFLSFIFLTKAINNPNSTEAIVASIVPFTAPVVMMSRVVIGIPEGVPLWQLIISMLTMIITTIFFIFLAARIYKVGILLYGKKVGWKDMAKWVFLK